MVCTLGGREGGREEGREGEARTCKSGCVTWAFLKRRPVGRMKRSNLEEGGKEGGREGRRGVSGTSPAAKGMHACMAYHQTPTKYTLLYPPLPPSFPPSFPPSLPPSL